MMLEICMFAEASKNQEEVFVVGEAYRSLAQPRGGLKKII
jgi:hypothetical protein